jgi:hypothetical protein
MEAGGHCAPQNLALGDNACLVCADLLRIRFRSNWKKLGRSGSVEGNNDVVQFQMEETKNE